LNREKKNYLRKNNSKRRMKNIKIIYYSYNRRKQKTRGKKLELIHVLLLMMMEVKNKENK
jgi:hypothetical protein